MAVKGNISHAYGLFIKSTALLASAANEQQDLAGCTFYNMDHLLSFYLWLRYSTHVPDVSLSVLSLPFSQHFLNIKMEIF